MPDGIEIAGSDLYESDLYRTLDEAASEAAATRPRIALLGSAPSSLNLAPYADPSWQIRGCSGGAAQFMSSRRVNAWYELHEFDSTKPMLSPEYIAFLKRGDFPVYMIEPHPEIPTSVRFPKDELLATFGPFFFTSTVSWMLAHALHFDDPQEIGMWGIDLAADSEYAYQRPGAHHFISIAMHRGIQVTVPPQSDLMKPPPMYGCAPVDPMTAKAITKTQELNSILAQARNELQAAMCKVSHVEGAIAMNEYYKAIWLTQDTKSVIGG